MAVKWPILYKRRLVCSIHVKNLGFSESNVLAEVGNKALECSFHMLDPKILLTKLDFVFQCFNLHKTN